MDQPTLAAYDAAAQAFASDWHAQPAPDDLHAIVRRFFKPGLTADIGCGSGREVAWLAANGFPALGYEPSQGLRAEARSRYPGLAFHDAALPELVGISDGAFENVLCETVIMHLRRESIVPSVVRLLSILKPDGVLYLSWRVTESADQRDGQGRLYAAFHADLVRAALGEATRLLDEEAISTSSAKKVHRMVVRKATNLGV
jgi:SAM-dependent methyltransferase